MTVSDIDVQVSYIGDGVTEDFTFNMKTYDPSWIIVYEDDAVSPAVITVVLNSDQDTSPGGSVNVVPAPALDVDIDIIREVPLTQLIDFAAYTGFPADTSENGLDKLTFIVQQLQALVGVGLTGTPTSVNPGAIIFAGATIWEETLLSEMVWDDINKLLGINVAAVLEKLHLQDGNLLVTQGTNAVQSTLANIGTVQSFTDLDGIKSMCVLGNYAYVVNTNDDSMRIIDITDPITPTIVGGLKDAVDMNGAWDIVCDGRYVYVSCNSDNSLRIIDVSDPTTPTAVGGVKDNTNLAAIKNIYLSGSYIYTANQSDDSLRIIDISDPTNPIIIGGVKDAVNLNGINDVYVVGKYAYVANSTDDSMRIIDVSDPTTPVIVGGLKDATYLNFARDLFVTGKYAYVTSSGALEIIDVSDPTTPVHAGRFVGVGDGMQQVVVADDYAYIAYTGDGYAGMRVLDVSDPTAPVLVASTGDIYVASSSLVLHGKYILINDSDADELNIIDISGVKTPAATIGNLFTTLVNVATNAIIGNDLIVGGGLNVSRNLLVDGNIISSNIDSVIKVVKSVDETVTSSTTLQDDDELVATLEPNSIYELTTMFKITSNGIADFKFQFIEADGVYDIRGAYWETDIGTVNFIITSEATTFSVIPITNTNEHLVELKGIIETGASGGVFQLQWAQFASDAVDTKLLANSYIKFVKINRNG